MSQNKNLSQMEHFDTTKQGITQYITSSKVDLCASDDALVLRNILKSKFISVNENTERYATLLHPVFVNLYLSMFEPLTTIKHQNSSLSNYIFYFMHHGVIINAKDIFSNNGSIFNGSTAVKTKSRGLRREQMSW